MTNEYPPQYIMAVAKLDEESTDELNVVKTHVFDISKEGALLTASCNELHLITSAETWDELEPKIMKMHIQKMRDIFGQES